MIGPRSSPLPEEILAARGARERVLIYINNILRAGTSRVAIREYSLSASSACFRGSPLSKVSQR